MPNAKFTVPEPENEPILNYGPGSKEKKLLKDKMAELKNGKVEIPLIIGGKEIKTGDMGECRVPHDHSTILGHYHKAGKKDVEMAIESAMQARKKWATMDWNERVAIFQRAAELLSTKYRYLLNAATMLTQSKNALQAEIDSACELIDFFRFNTYYAMQIYERQPNSAPGMWNQLEHRPLEGFVFAVTPFNFTSIAGNLPTAPAIMGNVAVWKPASSAVFSGYYLMKLFQEAGVPDGVINFVPGSGAKVGRPALENPNLAGIHFTGSTKTFQTMWKTVGKNIDKYKTYPRIVGETGGKDFIFAHPTVEVDTLKTAIVRAAFEYQGQKCSAASRAYIPASIWQELQEPLVQTVKELKMGTVEDFRNFINAVIDEAAFKSITSYIDFVKEAPDAEIIVGGNYDKSDGYFVEPTIVLTDKAKFKTMQEEIFGPVMTIYVYEDEEFEETLHLCDETSPYALTGSIMANDRAAIVKAKQILTNSAGNFYINDKPTAAVVGQQPFGGARASGTNDKAGDMVNLLRWVSPRTMKETFNPPTDYKYPFMKEK